MGLNRVDSDRELAVGSEDSDLRDNWLFEWVLHLRTASAETGFNLFSVPARTVAGRIGSPVLVLCIGAPAEASC